MTIKSNTSKTKGERRSPKWAEFRRKYLKGKVCAVCGGKTKLEAHHIIPFSLDRSKELDESNLIPLCEGRKTINCHLIIGHGGDWRDYNPYVKKTARFFRWLFKHRQKW